MMYQYQHTYDIILSHTAIKLLLLIK